MPQPKLTAEEQKAYDEALRRIEECRQKGNYLVLSKLGLTLLPPEIGQLRALTHLYLYSNKLTALPPEIGQLSALTKLDLSSNQLTALPPEIGQLRALKNLDLCVNKLTALPPEIDQLRAQKEFFLSWEYPGMPRLDLTMVRAVLKKAEQRYHAQPSPLSPLIKPPSAQPKPPASQPSPAESSRPFDVFISYSSHKKLLADAICHSLEAGGVRCWIAPRDIVAGDKWARAIDSAIPKCRGMLLVFSSHANSSDDVAREVSLAADHKLWLLPVRVEDVKPEGELNYYMRNTHWLDAMPPPVEKHLENIRKQVQELVARSRRHSQG